ncbi:hypothetical protein TRIP_E280286 [uncultured Spirochaetota bacterium]|nr:hypothetical protein TRIP_E280286 [uncultured Spirochaetota bacterium]
MAGIHLMGSAKYFDQSRFPCPILSCKTMYFSSYDFQINIIERFYSREVFTDSTGFKDYIFFIHWHSSQKTAPELQEQLL